MGSQRNHTCRLRFFGHIFTCAVLLLTATSPTLSHNSKEKRQLQQDIRFASWAKLGLGCDAAPFAFRKTKFSYSFQRTAGLEDADAASALLSTREAQLSAVCLDSNYRFNEHDLQKYQFWIKTCLRFSQGERIDVCLRMGEEEYCWLPAKVQWHTWRNNLISRARTRGWVDGGRFCIVVDKAAYTLTLYEHGQRKVSFPVDLGYSPYLDRVTGGKGCTPEGLYIVEYKEWSKYTDALLLGYPNLYDMEVYRRIQDKVSWDIGQWLEIHGAGVPFVTLNWTWGCVALADSDIAKLYSALGLPTSRQLRVAKPSKRRRLWRRIRKIESKVLVAIVRYSEPLQKYCTGRN